MTKAVKKPDKPDEFRAFLKAIEWGQAEHWVDIAEAIGVHQNTITAWKKSPEGRKALRKGIERSLAAMEQAGSKDWRMWEKKLAMLGVNPGIKIDGKLQVNVVHEILTKAGLLNDGQTSEASERSPEDQT